MQQLLSDEIRGFMQNASWIRKMFEAGVELKKKYGKENVFDFSLGNPDLPPPPEVKQALFEIAQTADQPFALGYMPNAGFMETRAALAEKISAEQSAAVPPENIIVTCGAAGGINVFFRAVLVPGDEVICPAPYFVEYGFYAGNFGGKLVPVKCKEDFSLNVEALEQAITPATRAVIVNSPNNPTGQIYSQSELAALADVLRRASKKFGRLIYLVSDEPYRFLNFDGLEIPSIFANYEASVVIGSFSKSLSLAGERIGYIAVSPSLEGASELVAGLTLTNRILGFVNAPTVAQSIIKKCINSQVNLDIYRRRRDLMAQVLTEVGIKFNMPHGAFYFFPKSPTEDESIFVNALLEQRVLVVPGRGFGLSGYFRMVFCVEDHVILGAKEPMLRAMDSLK